MYFREASTQQNGVNKMRAHSSPWILDEPDNKIVKEIIFLDWEGQPKVQIHYIFHPSMHNLLPGTHHLAIMFTPSLGIQQGYLALNIVVPETGESRSSVVSIRETIDGASLFVLENEGDVQELAKLFIAGKDLVFEFHSKDEPVLRFLLPYENGFEEKLVKLMQKK